MKMRKVKYSSKKWIPYTSKDEPGHYEYTEVGAALFHKFSTEYEEFENGPGNYTVAVIELGNGEVKLVSPDCIKFMEGAE
jgi:hypothetical protein